MTNTSHEAREAIMQSIRSNLAASEGIAHTEHTIVPEHDELIPLDEALSPIERFRERLESVGGHCDIVKNEDEAAGAVSALVTDLQTTNAAKRIAMSDAPALSRFTRDIAAEIDVCPAALDLFNYDV